jgi:hypothetical protein
MFCHRHMRLFVLTAATLVGAGVGKFVVEKLANRLKRRYRDFGGLVACTSQACEWVASCAPAVAVALLAQETLRDWPRGIARPVPDETRRVRH